MKIKINNQEYEAQLGESVLEVCRREGIRIPTLCAHDGLPHEAVCRLCLVEVNKTDKLVTSCTFPVCDGLEVTTEGERIKKARDINMELLWADHAGKCTTCKKNRRCELQNLAEEHKIENFHFVPRRGEITAQEELALLKDNWARVVVDDHNPAIARTTELCVECRRCINICPTREFSYNHRSGAVVVGTPHEAPLDCIFCGACVNHCPTGAITDQNDLEAIQAKLDDLKKLAVVIVDPAIIGSLTNEFEYIDNQEKLIGLLRQLGFEKVFSLSWGMEAYVTRLAECLERNKTVEPLLASLCPAFTNYVDKYYPDLKSRIVPLATPDELLATTIKTEYAKKEKINPQAIVVVSLSACVAKKMLVGGQVDHVLTVRELGRLSRKKLIKENEIKSAYFDKPFVEDQQVEREMIHEGGLVNLLTERKKAHPFAYRAVSGVPVIKSALELLRSKREQHGFIEALICEGGCVNGGGNSINVKCKSLKSK